MHSANDSKFSRDTNQSLGLHIILIGKGLTMNMAFNETFENWIQCWGLYDLIQQSKKPSLQALGDETDFTKPHTMRVIEKFLVDCSEAVSKRYTR